MAGITRDSLDAQSPPARGVEQLDPRQRTQRRPPQPQQECPDQQRPSTMSSWLGRTASSHTVQIAATAVVSGALVAGAILGYQHVNRQHRLDDLKRSIPALDEEHDVEKLTDFGAASPSTQLQKDEERSVALAARAQQGDYDDNLILEQLARNRVFLTDAGLARLRSAFVVVVGCGGVGSHAAAALARSGTSKIRLIDFDQVTLSSLNRHALATLADVGTPKVNCIRKRLEAITPWVQFDCRNEVFSESHLEPFHEQKPDYIIDAIDNIDSKVNLLAYCKRNLLPVISSMGAGCKSDPTRILIGDISSSIEDPLSRSVRRRLRALGIDRGITVVYSTEKPGPGKAQLLPLPDEEFAKGGVGELGVLPDFRVRILPVLGTMPAVFGNAVANHIILELTNYPHEYPAGKVREKMYDAILSALQAHEDRLAAHQSGIKDVLGVRLPVTKEDVGYLIEEVFHGHSVVSGLPARLALVRWQAPTASSYDLGKRTERQMSSRLELRDLVCMTKEEAAVHEREVLKGGKRPEDVYSREVLELVAKRREEEEYYEQYR